jgi:hypothetical protein
MKRQSSTQIPNFTQISERLFEIAEAGGGHFFYSNIRDDLESLISDGYEKQAKDVAIDIMKSYTHRPALIWELNKLLTNDEITDFETWRKTAKSNKPRSRCSKCGSTKIASILYGLVILDEKLEKQFDRGVITLGGCCITDHDPKYECMTCGMKFYKRPTGKNPNWTGKIIVIKEDADHNILISGAKHG